MKNISHGDDGPRPQRSQRKIKIALLFIIIDEFPLENIWTTWLKSHPAIVVWFHAKFPQRAARNSAWVAGRLLNGPASPPRAEWGSLQLTQTMFYMLSRAYADGAQKFVFLSESCIPVIPVESFVETAAASGDKSWMLMFTEPSNFYVERDQMGPLRAEIPANCVVKTDQWIMLSRPHAQKILEMEKKIDLWRLFRKVHASDEMFFSSVLAMAAGGVENLRASGEVMERRVTYVDWSENGKSPRTHYHITRDLVVAARRDFGSPFLRKIKLPCTVGIPKESGPKGPKGPSRNNYVKREQEEYEKRILLWEWTNAM